MAKFTKGKWVVGPNKCEDEANRTTIGIYAEKDILPNGRPIRHSIALLHYYPDRADEVTTNAQELCRRWNAFEDLYEACKFKSILAEAAYTGGDVPKKWIRERGNYIDGWNAAIKVVKNILAKTTLTL